MELSSSPRHSFSKTDYGANVKHSEEAWKKTVRGKVEKSGKILLARDNTAQNMDHSVANNLVQDGNITLGTKTSLPKDMHLIPTRSLSDANISKTLTLSPVDYSRRRELIDLREEDATQIRERSSIFGRSNPGYFMRKMLSDLRRMNTSMLPKEQSLPSISPKLKSGQNMNDIHPHQQDSDPTKNNSKNSRNSSPPPSGQKRQMKTKDLSFSSASISKYSTGTRATATTATTFSERTPYSFLMTSIDNGDQIIRSDTNPTVGTNLNSVNSDREAISTLDNSTMTVSRRKRDCSKDPFLNNLKDEEGMLMEFDGKARKTMPSSLFGKGKAKVDSWCVKNHKRNTDIKLICAMAFPFLDEDEGSSDSGVSSTPQTIRIFPKNSVDWDEKKRFVKPTHLSLLSDDFKKSGQYPEVDIEAKYDANSMACGEAEQHRIDIKRQKKKEAGTSLFTGNKSNQRKKNLQKVENPSQKI